MIKVVLLLAQLRLRLKQSQVQVVIKKQKEIIRLGSQLKVQDGICHANLTTEFYVTPNDTNINIQVIIVQGNQRKLAGNSTINILQYEQSVYHETISVLHNSPDKQARILFTFIYFGDSQVIDKRHMFLSSDRHQQQYKTMQSKNHVLQNQNKQLGQDFNHIGMSNDVLSFNKEEQRVGIVQYERVYNENMLERKKDIGDSKQEHQNFMGLKEELVQLMKGKGKEANEEP